MPKIYLALGANQGDRQAFIEQAIKLLSEKIIIKERAPLYETKAVGFTAQADFLNTVLAGETELRPLALLNFIKEVEKIAGRRARFHWGPREIDIDLLFYDDLVYHDNILDVPHPLIAARAFVLRPLADLAPDLIHPVLGQTVAELLAQLPPRATAASQIKKYDSHADKNQNF